MNLTEETVATVTTRAAPPAVVAGLNFFGFTLPELVQLVSLIWFVILIIEKVSLLYRQWKKKGADDEPC